MDLPAAFAASDMIRLFDLGFGKLRSDTGSQAAGCILQGEEGRAAEPDNRGGQNHPIDGDGAAFSPGEFFQYISHYDLQDSRIVRPASAPARRHGVVQRKPMIEAYLGRHGDHSLPAPGKGLHPGCNEKCRAPVGARHQRLSCQQNRDQLPDEVEVEDELVGACSEMKVPVELVRLVAPSLIAV